VLIKANDNEVEIELVGDIATMIELTIPTQAAKNAALSADLRRSVKVVAGVTTEQEKKTHRNHVFFS
jgi:hypothetical protein